MAFQLLTLLAVFGLLTSVSIRFIRSPEKVQAYWVRYYDGHPLQARLNLGTAFVRSPQMIPYVRWMGLTMAVVDLAYTLLILYSFWYYSSPDRM